MKRILFAAFCLLPLALHAEGVLPERLSEPQAVRAEADTTLLDELDGILGMLDGESISVKNEMADFFISSCEDSLTRQQVALHLYNYYRESSLLGVEAVSIHVFDKWFADSTLTFPSEEEFFLAKLHARVNSETLLGLKAPSITLFDPDGAGRVIPGERASIVFFYDTDCVKCGYYTIALASGLANSDPAADFYAVYVGNDREKWDNYRKNAFPELEHCARLRLYHLWDPEGLSLFPIHYGVTTTPKLFLLDADSRVMGRCLDPYSLETLLGFPQLSLCPVGEKLPSLKLEGTMYGCKNGKIRERKVKRKTESLRSTLLFIYSPDCPDCKREMEGLASYLGRHPERQVFAVEASVDLVKYFDLSILPFEAYVGKNGRVESKYLSILEEKEN